MSRKNLFICIIIFITTISHAQKISNDLIRDGDNRFLYIMDFTDEYGFLSTTVYMIEFPNGTENIKFNETINYSNRLKSNIKYWTISAYIFFNNQWYFIQYDLSSDSYGESPSLYCLGKKSKKIYEENIYDIDLQNSGFKTQFNCEISVKHYEENIILYQEGDIPIGTYIPQKLDMPSLDIKGSYLFSDNKTNEHILVNEIQNMLVKWISEDLIGRNRYF